MRAFVNMGGNFPGLPCFSVQLAFYPTFAGGCFFNRGAAAGQWFVRASFFLVDVRLMWDSPQRFYGAPSPALPPRVDAPWLDPDVLAQKLVDEFISTLGFKRDDGTVPQFVADVNPELVALMRRICFGPPVPPSSSPISEPLR
jgi:hypothetical protein